MANELSSADQRLTKEQQAEIARLKEEYAKYQAAGDTDRMQEAHKAAEDIRASAGYSGGGDGSGYVPLSNQQNNKQEQAYNTGYQIDNNQQQTQNGGYSAGDSNLSAELQAEIARLKEEYARYQAAGNTAGMAAAHEAAEKIRNSAGYSGGADGSQSIALSSGGGASADEVEKWLNDYWYTNYNAKNGWVNGFSGQMNQRSMANYIRQQMEANSKAWFDADAAGKAYLHDQNVKLAELLKNNSGGTESMYDPATGQWYTANANLGYGVNVGQYNPADLDDWYKAFAGMTDEQIQAYRNDTNRYRNYVDQNLIRNWIDESSGYTGVYSQFVNGPYAQLLTGDKASNVNPTTYTDVQGDGFNEKDYTPPLDAYGNIVPQPPALKNNNAMTDNTRQFASYVDENGIIQPGLLRQTNPAGNARPGYGQSGNGTYSGNTALETGESNNYNPYAPDYYRNLMDASGNPSAGQGVSTLDGSGTGSTGSGTTGTGSYFSNLSAPSTGGDLSDYINQIYDASLRSQLAQLEAAYQESLTELQRNQEETDAEYNEQKRQTQGDAERSAASWRELAVAQGLNTGAMGQAALAQNNQLQGNLNTLSAAQAKELANIQNQRALLGKQYQLQILQAQADNDMERAQMLYQEAVRMDEVMMQKEAQAMSMMQTLLGYAASGSGSSSYSGSAGSGSGSSGGYSSSGGSSSGSGSSGGNYDGLWAAAMASGYPQSYISNNYKKYGFTSSSGLWAEYQNYAENLNIAQSFVDNMLKNATSSQFNGYTVISGTSKLTDEQKKLANEILDEYVKSGYLKYPNP